MTAELIDPLKVKDWERHISPRETGEVGRVYFLNCRMIFKNGKEWTRHWQLTLNPDQGSTVEGYLKNAIEVPPDMRSELLTFRHVEKRLTGGSVYKLWISDDPAPDTWGIERQERPLLFDLNGQPINGSY